MSDRKLAKSVQSLLRQIWRLHRSITKAFVTWLLRTALVVQRNRRYASAGFVLPTTVLLILVVALTTGALTYRAFNTSTRTIADTQSRVIYNAATPAVDRARSKIEFLFDANKDTRYPGGVPSEDFMTSMMLNATPAVPVKGQSVSALSLTGGGNGIGNNRDPYTLPDETRVDINGDGAPDNAWRYKSDTNGDGTADATVVYSIILSTPPDVVNGSTTTKGTDRLIALTDQQKANGEVDASSGRRLSYTRSGPLSNKAATGGCASSASTGTRVEGGWYPDTGNSSVLRKNFQVDAFVVPDNVGTTGAANFTTLEFQQDRKLDRGNKWGAWFRNDMEIFPGPQFNWNGAIHTEGNLMIGNTSFSAYLISSPASCLFYESASEISVTSVQEQKDGAGNVITPAFNGVIASGKINDNSYGGSSLIYLHSPNPTTTKVTMGTGNDWTNGSATPFQVSSDSTAIQIKDGRQSRAPDTTNAAYFTQNTTFAGRFASRSEKAPYVDDTYRADNRYGPKPIYDASAAIPAGKKLGDIIQPTDNVSRDPDPAKAIPAGQKLIAADPAAGADSTTVGLDGYWERRARNQGLRILVSERLELGNSNGWVAPEDRPNGTPQDPKVATPTTAPFGGDGDYVDLRQRGSYVTSPTDASQADPDTSDDEGDPLYPPHGAASTTITHEARQRRALRDNIAAVQSTAVYHAAVSRDYPVACLASTAHPGTPFTLRQSINFVPTFLVNSTPGGLPDTAGGLASVSDTVLMTDFFNGRGTNGWEFDPPSQTQSQFETDMNNPTSPLRKALKNLAQFAGDHVSDTQTGSFPPTQELPGGLVHPYPNLTMWGNYSNLRRTLAQLESGTAYSDLSPADKTYLQTAACTTGILAYNIDRVQRFDPRNPGNDKIRPGQGQPIMQALGLDLFRLMDGIVDEANNNYEVLPKSQLATYGYDPAGTPNTQNYNPRDYDRVPAEAFLGKLREYIIASSPTPSFNDPRLRTAELIFEYFQIRRDRTYGFRPSPAANTWNFNPFVTTSAPGPGTMLWSSACDPNIFALAVDSFSRTTGKTTADAYDPAARYDVGVLRLALSRLCGTVIPAAAVRDFPGDIGLPQRYSGTNSAALDTSKTLIPKVAPNDYLAYLPKAGTLFPDKAPTRQSPANFQSGVLAAAPFNDGVYLQATVAPKWPSLYYLFPEVDHSHVGGIERLTTSSGATVCLDHRQPDGALRHVDPTSCTDSGQPVLPAAFQPWAEPYIVDNYIRNTVNKAPVVYQRVDSLSSPVFDANTYESYTSIPRTYVDANSGSMTFTYRVLNNPLSDLPVYNVALRPRKLPSGFTNPFPIQDNPTWQLPALVTNSSGQVAGENNQYRPPNRILAPNGNNNQGVVAAIPFLDRVMFSGREWMPLRVMDIDLGLLRRTRPSPQGGANASSEAYPPDSTTKSDVWLPVSGVVYAFREDSVREDAINRPPATAQTNGTPPNPLPTTDVRNPNLPLDPPLQWIYSSNSDPKISVKPVDGVADPDRRPHGFRLRNGTQLARHSSMNIPAQDNIRGLSFFTDNPVFIMGNYNLHQNGTDDQDTGVTRLEEFTELLPSTGQYTEAQFYARKTKDTRFADATQDRWRPSEILADAISVISDTLCDGSAIDTFMTTGQNSGGVIDANDFSGRQFTDSGAALPAGFLPYNQRYASSGTGGVSVYDNRTAGLFGPGCTGASSNTTFINQNRPSTTTLLTPSLTTSWSWLRENPFDIFSPVKISRNGSGLLVPPLPAAAIAVPSPSVYNPDPRTYTSPTTDPASQASKPRSTVAYTASPVNGAFYNITNGRPLQTATDSRVNTIIVSGLVPSRQNQSYGGLHNFPRFLEDWNYLWFSGSFLQLNFSNYATAPFDQQVWEPGQNPTANNEKISYYSPPQRLWGYDVALQLAPAGPAAARFVTPSKERNEFYSEPPANDPYIRNLCVSLPDTVIPDSRCPS